MTSVERCLRKNLSLPEYKKLKIKTLTKEFKFRLTNEEILHFNELKSEIAVDQYVRSLYNKYL